MTDLATDAAAKVLKTSTRVPLAETTIYSARPVSAGAFGALRERLARAALAAAPDRVIANAVTEISSLRRGLRPVDTFSLMDDDVVNSQLGPGIFSIHNTTGAAVKLVAPIDFFLKAKRDEATGELLKVKELLVKAHFVSLVPDLETPGHFNFRTDDAAFQYPPADVAAYKRAMAAKLLASPMADAAFHAWANANINATAVPA